MDLYNYRNKRVKLTCIDGEAFRGKADWYSPPQDNEDNLASICIGDCEFKENEIQTIEIVE